MIGNVVDWFTRVERKTDSSVISPPPMFSKTELAKMVNPYGYPTPYAYDYWVANAREFDDEGNQEETFMTWFRRCCL